MRILFVHERFGEWAGAEVNARLTATALRRRGHEVGLLYGAATGRGTDLWLAAFSLQAALPSAGAAAATAALLAAFRPEVIYVHKMADLAVLETLVASGLPVVRMVHDHDLYCPRSYKYHYFSRQICRRPLSPYCLVPCGAFVQRQHGGGFPLRWTSYSAKKRELRLNQRFQRLIVASQYMKEELIRNGFLPEQVELLPPVPAALATPPRPEPAKGNLVVYAGQVIRGKGVDVLLESLARVKAPFECLIFGDGNHRAYCERLCQQLLLADRVRFRGYVPQAELALAYRKARVAVLSSVWPEPFGAVGLEAMRHGVPVVAFDAGGIGEWLVDGVNGYLVPWMDREEFAARLEQLLADPAWAEQLGRNARDWVSHHCDFPRYMSNLEALFERVTLEARQPSETLHHA